MEIEKLTDMLSSYLILIIGFFFIVLSISAGWRIIFAIIGTWAISAWYFDKAFEKERKLMLDVK